MYPEALLLGATLLKELKKLDDKYLLVEVSVAAIEKTKYFPFY